MKSYVPCVAFLVISGILTSPQTSNVTSVPVEEEPLHKVVFKNDAVTVMHVILPPGQTTLFHSHTHDRVAIDLSTTTIAQQKINEPEGPSTRPGSSRRISRGLLHSPSPQRRHRSLRSLGHRASRAADNSLSRRCRHGRRRKSQCPRL